MLPAHTREMIIRGSVRIAAPRRGGAAALPLRGACLAPGASVTAMQKQKPAFSQNVLISLGCYAIIAGVVLWHCMPVWWNWQTRRTQNPKVAIPCRFDPDYRHQGNVIRTGSSSWEMGSDYLLISRNGRRPASKNDSTNSAGHPAGVRTRLRLVPFDRRAVKAVEPPA